MTLKGQHNNKVDILGLNFDHTTMLQMVENIKTFLCHLRQIIYL